MNVRPLVLCLGLVLLTAPVLAQSGTGYVMNRRVVAGGGRLSEAGNAALSATIGQADAGVLSAPRYALLGGFWAAVLPAAKIGRAHV